MNVSWQVVKILAEKSRLDENEKQSIQCPLNIEIDKYKRCSEPKKYVYEYQIFYLESLIEKFTPFQEEENKCLQNNTTKNYYRDAHTWKIIQPREQPNQYWDSLKEGILLHIFYFHSTLWMRWETYSPIGNNH